MINLTRATRAVLFGLALGAVLASAGTNSNGGAVQASSGQTNTVEFAIPLTAQQAGDVLLGRHVRIVSLTHSTVSNGITFTGGVFPVDQRSPNALAVDFRASRVGTLTDLRDSALALATRLNDRVFDRYRSALEDQFARVDEPGVIRAEVSATPAQLDELRRDPRVRTVAAKASRSLSAVSETKHGLAAPLALASRENWVPDDDYVSAQPSNVGGRYVQQDFFYAAGRTINMGGAGGGLEMKYHQNKYDGGTYFDTSESGNRIPIVLAWSSTIPCPYLDSRAPNPLEEPSWTLGSNGDNGCWNAWSSGAWYDNYVRVSNGPEDVDDSKVIVSHEQCGPLGTCDTWNMTMDDNCPYGSWPIAVPTWQWHWNRFSGAPGVSPCM